MLIFIYRTAELFYARWTFSPLPHPTPRRCVAGTYLIAFAYFNQNTILANEKISVQSHFSILSTML